MTPHRIPIRLADGSVVYSEGIGTVQFSPVVHGQEMAKLEFTNVLYVPSLSSNLFSVLYLTMHRSFTILIERDTLHFIRDNKILFQAHVSPSNSAFLLGNTIPVQQIASLSTSSPLPLDLSLWHRRLCHQHLAGVKKLLSGNLVTGFRLDSQADPDPVCEACKAGKMHANPFPTSHSRASKPLQLIHSDVHGPVKVTGHRLGCLGDDKGGEYMSREFEAFCIDHGIQRRHSAWNRPQQNAPHELFLGNKPDVSMLRVWGCTAYVLVQKDKRPLGSLGSHMEKCIFIGYPDGYKAWKFYCPESKKVIISEQADFDECFFINQRYSTPHIPPPHPESLLEPSTPSINLSDVFDDAPEYPSHSQLPVHGGDSPSASEQPPACSLTPSSPNIFHTAPGSASPPISSSSNEDTLLHVQSKAAK